MVLDDKPPLGGTRALPEAMWRKRTTSQSRSLKDICEHALGCARELFTSRLMEEINRAAGLRQEGDERRIISVFHHLSAEATLMWSPGFVERCKHGRATSLAGPHVKQAKHELNCG